MIPLLESRISILPYNLRQIYLVLRELTGRQIPYCKLTAVK